MNYSKIKIQEEIKDIDINIKINKTLLILDKGKPNKHIDSAKEKLKILELSRRKLEQQMKEIKSATYQKAVLELDLLKQLEQRPFVLDFEKEILRLVEAFGKKKAAGKTHATVISDVVHKLLIQEPLLEVTGEKDEWFKLKEFYQSKRSNQLRKYSEDGEAVYLDAIIFVNEKGDVFRGEVNGISSVQKVKFPFVPKTFYINIKKDLLDPDKVYKNELDYYSIEDKNQLDEVFDCYVK